MTLRANQRGQFLPVLLVVLVVVLIVVAVLYLLHRHKGQATAPAFKSAVHHVAATVKKMKPKMKAKPSSSPAATQASAPGDNAFDIDGPLKNRQILYRVLPEYPESAQEQGIQGKVVFEFHTKDDGSVSSNIILRHSSTSAELDNAAEDALLQWKFSTGPAPEGVNLITFNFYMNAGH